MRKRAISHISLLLLALGVGCSSAPKKEEIPVTEQLRRDSALGRNLTEKFETHLTFKEDMEVSVYLRSVAEKLTLSTIPLHEAPIGVRVIKDRSEQWRNYALPGNRIYLSAGLLKQFEFENEIAASMAFELAHILKRHVGKQLEARQELIDSSIESASVFGGAGSEDQSSSVEFFGPSGVFAFSEEQILQSARESVHIMYRAGYDPRGLISMWRNILEHPEHAYFEKTTLERIIAATRETYAALTPIRNPIVRTDSFLKVRQRIASL